MKRSSRGVESENKILEAAVALFAEKGFRDTKVSDIVKAAGLTQAAFYLYFPSKEAIFQEIMERFYEKVEKHLLAAAVPAEVTAEVFPIRVQENIAALFRLFQTDPKLTKIFLTEERSIDDVETLIHQTIVGNLLHHRAAGFVRKDLSPAMVASSMIGMFIQVTVKELIEKQRPAEEVACEFTQLLLFGLANTQGRGSCIE